MSKIGRMNIILPKGVTVIDDKNTKTLDVKGQKGQMKVKYKHPVSFVIDNDKVKVLSESNTRQAKAFWGLYRSLLNGAVVGVSQGYEKQLEFIGVGYKASVTEKKITLNLGYSHEIFYEIPKDINAKMEKDILVLQSFDKKQLADFTAKIKSNRPPEPYKGKGIKEVGEYIRRKEGKKK